ncbi:hypothetical protein JCM3775_002942 [Rhodotorula graminis]
MLVANFGLTGPTSPPRRTRSPSTSPSREPSTSPRRRAPAGKPLPPVTRQPLSPPSTSSHDPCELFSSDDALAATASSPTTRDAPGPPSHDTSSRSPSSPPTRHHLRSSSLLEAAHIAPRDATWQCKGDEGGLCFARRDQSARSWEDEPGPGYGVPCDGHDVREVCGGVVLASHEPEDTLGGATHEATIMRRHGSQQEEDAVVVARS